MVGVSRSRTREETIMIYLLLNVFHGRLLTPTCGSIGGLRTHFPEYFIGYVQLRKQIYMTLNWKVLTHLLPRLLQLSAHPDSSLKHVGTPQTLLKDWWKLRPRSFFLAFSFSNYQVSSPNGKIPVKINDLSFFFFYVRMLYEYVCIYIILCVSAKNYCCARMLIMNNERFSAPFLRSFIVAKQ